MIALKARLNDELICLGCPRLIDIVQTMSDNKSMKTIRWSQEKNRQLQEERGLTFEMVLAAIERGDVLDDLVHPNLTRYPNQRMMVVRISNYAFLERRFSNPKSPMTIMKNHKDTKDTKFFIMQFMNTESVF
jgi:hypothetical protein